LVWRTGIDDRKETTMKVSAFSIAHKSGEPMAANRADLPELLYKMATECLIVCEGFKGVPRDRIAAAFFAGALTVAPEKVNTSWAFQVALRGFAAVAEWTGIDDPDVGQGDTPRT
jgi:hypothetical protein